MKYPYKTCMYTAILFMYVGCAHAVDFRQYPALVSLVETMVRDDGYPQQELEKVLSDAVIDQGVIKLITHPSEALPWHKYLERLVTEKRIDEGVAWWKSHQVVLQQATQQYGVPPEIIAAIIGIETNYGTYIGKRRVLDSLVTLAATYPRRSKFFSRELRVFLNTARADNIDSGEITGSYAGAIGIPQFMPSSYQVYAVDFNQNGRRDLVKEVEDAIGSVANYLKRHGWHSEQKVFASVTDDLPQTGLALLSKRSKPKLSAKKLVASGITFDSNGASAKVTLLRLQQANGYRYIVGFNNLYVITRYNTSINYAVAVTELSRRMRERFIH